MNKYSSIGVGLIILLWIIIFQFNLVSNILVPSPIRVVEEIGLFFVSKDTIVDLLTTIYRVLICFIGTIIIGIPSGLVLGYFKKLYKIFEVPIDFFRSLPATALFPLFMLFFGIGDRAKVLLIVSWCSLVTLIYTSYGVKNCPKIKIMAAKTMKLTKLSLFSKVIFPEALPEIASGLRISLSIVLILVVVLEMFTGSELGIGKRIYDSNLMFRITEMYAVIIITGVLGYLLNRVFVFFEGRIVHWAGK